MNMHAKSLSFYNQKSQPVPKTELLLTFTSRLLQRGNLLFQLLEEVLPVAHLF